MRRALAGLAALAVILPAGISMCGTLNDHIDLRIQTPDMFVNVLNPPRVPIMHASEEVRTIHTPREFELQAFLWEYNPPRPFHRRGFHIVRVWKRFLADLPKPGHAKNLQFPDLRKTDQADDLLPCEPGPYFMQFHIIITSSSGNKQNIHAFFPYLQRKGVDKYKEVPPPKQSWQVACGKTGQVPDPKGTSTPVLTLGAAGWTVTP